MTYRTLLGLAAVILAATAALHATGLSTLTATLAESALPEHWVPIFQGLWLMFSIHLVIIAALLIAMAIFPAGRGPLAVVSALPVADTILLLAVVGVFIGSVMTGAAALCVLAALTLHPRGASST